jgi:hypothetical protein
VINVRLLLYSLIFSLLLLFWVWDKYLIFFSLTRPTKKSAYFFFYCYGLLKAFHNLICCSEDCYFSREDYPVITFRPRARQLFQYRHYRYCSCSLEILQRNLITNFCISLMHLKRNISL